MSTSGNRGPLIASAVSFLRDPSTAQSPLAQRIGFLESKGLTSQEIELAMQQAASQQQLNGTMMMQQHAGQRGGAGGRMMTREYERDWRDWFIMTVVGGSVGYLAVKLAQKFIVPHLQPPSETELEAAQTALEAKYDEASAMIKELQLSTDSLAASLDDQRAAVEKELEQVKKAVEEMREGERRREEWSRKVGEQVEEVVRSLPSLIEKQANSQAQSLTDLQTELKSLKSLLIARRPAAATTGSSSPTPSYSAPVPDTPRSPASTATPSAVSTSANTTSTSTSSGLLGARKPGIPAWQMRGSTASIASGATTPTTPTAAAEEDTSASGVLVEKPNDVSAGSSSSNADATTSTTASGPTSTGEAAGPSASTGVQIEDAKDDGKP